MRPRSTAVRCYQAPSTVATFRKVSALRQEMPSPPSRNYAFPARECGDGNYCAFLARHMKLTEPVKCGPGSLSDNRELSKSAVDLREARHGRVMMGSQHYYETKYWGYMLDTMPAETLRT
jgi:hypothetical protein